MATSDEILQILVKMRGGQQFRTEAEKSAAAVKKVGHSAEATGFATERATIKLGKFRTTLGLVGRSALTVAGVAGIGGLVAALHYGVGAFEEHQKVAASTAAALKSTGGAANVTMGQIEAQATSLSHLSGVDDETIMASQALLLTFRNVRDEAGKGNDIFHQTTEAALNLSQGMKMMGKSLSVSDAMLQLGKALNDPAKGMARLQRIGITFSQHQIDVVKKLVKTHQTLKAQQLILGEVNKEFAGQAAAYGKTLPGSIERLQTASGNLGEALVTGLAPSLTTAANSAATFVNQMIDGTGAGGRFRDRLKDIGDTITNILGPPLGFVVDHIGTITKLLIVGAGAWATYRTAMILTRGVMLTVEAIQFAAVFLAAADAIGVASAAMMVLDVALLANPIGIVVVAVAAAIAAFILLGGHLSTVGQWFVKLGGWIAGAAREVWHLWTTFTPAGQVTAFIIGHLGQIVGFIRAMPGQIADAATGMFDGIKNAFRDAINWVIGAWDSLHFHVPGVKAFGHHIGGFDLGTPHIPRLGDGGTLMSSGMVEVGDKGRELLSLPKGAQVQPLPAGDRRPLVVNMDGKKVAEIVFDHVQFAAARG